MTDGSHSGPGASAQKTLEWPAVLEAWRARCASMPGAERLADFVWPSGAAAIRRRLEEVSQASSLIDGRGAGGVADTAEPDLSALPEVGETLERAGRGGDLDAPALLSIASLARLARDAGGRLLLRAGRFPGLAALFADAGGDLDLPRLAVLAAAVEAVVGPDGEVRDDASEELSSVRRRIADTRERIRRRLDGLLATLGDNLQDRFVTEREGRSVIPVKVEARSRVPGIVHGMSASGATVFVEPHEIVSEGNDLRMLEAAERREVARLLRDLSRRVEADAEPLGLAFRGLVALDHRLAAARLAAALRAVVPEIAEDGPIALEAARHPLLVLAGGEVVPNDIEIAPGGALVISGPNAGGKTVTMKTLGLAVLMAHAGLPVPARTARIRVTREVFCEIGDEQSIALSLSSFSAHVTHVAGILAGVRPGDLVLVDELAGGTDPDEGAALAVALVRALVSGGAAAIVTTHYEPLKRLHETDRRVRSASVGIDPRTMRPTYMLRPGEVGASGALAAAERYGLPADVITEARSLLPRIHVETRDRLAEAEALRARAAGDAAAAARERQETEAERRRLEAETARARAHELSAVRDEVAGLWRQIHALREETRAARRYLRESRRPSADTVRSVESRVEAVAGALGPAGPVETALRGGVVPGKEVPAASHRPGDTVHVVPIGRSGVIVDVEGDDAVVAFGSVKTRARLADLRRVKRGVLEDARPPRGAAPRRAGRAPPVAAEAAAGSRPPSWRPKEASNTIDLRGMRADEAVDALDAGLDRLFQAEAGVAYVVHGFGTGAVRKAVREHLPAHPLVAEWRPCTREEGGDGATVVVLR